MLLLLKRSTIPHHTLRLLKFGRLLLHTRLVEGKQSNWKSSVHLDAQRNIQENAERKPSKK